MPSPQPLLTIPPRTVTILGSTGSIGRSTIGLMEEAPERFTAAALVAGRNVEELAEQARKVRPARAVIADETQYAALKEALAGTGVEAAAGRAAVLEAAAMPADRVVGAMVGAAGLEPVLTALRQGTDVALANKECLVCAGHLVTAEAAHHGAALLPVDSEHNAIFQVFESERAEAVSRITLTASGGPFFGRTRAELKTVTPAEAVAHPNWDMGAKISVDSATMMNKGLELVEAWHLFPVDASQLDVVVHRESIIHSLVHYADGSTLAQLGHPDMRTPISYALAWPERAPIRHTPLDLAALGTLSFAAPDTEAFPALSLARQALEAGGAATLALNAANEVAVAAFLEGKLPFTGIADTVAAVLDAEPGWPVDTLSDILAADSEVRRWTKTRIGEREPVS